MTTNKADAADLRVCERIGLSRSVTVTGVDGLVVEGGLINVSLGGVSVELTGGTDHFARGQVVALRLSSKDEAAPYGCAVMWADKGLLGLSIDRKSAARLALELTHGMFARHGRPVDTAPAA